MTLPRSAADVLSGHVVFELECIDRIYCNLYVPKLQRDLGVVGFIREHLDRPVASTAGAGGSFAARILDCTADLGYRQQT